MAEKLFPLIREDKAYANKWEGPLFIPWSIAEKAYKAYSKKYGTGQTMQRMADRGGFGVEEMDRFHPGWRGEMQYYTERNKRMSTDYTDDFRQRLDTMKDAYTALVAQGIIDAPITGEIDKSLMVSDVVRGEAALWLARALAHMEKQVKEMKVMPTANTIPYSWDKAHEYISLISEARRHPGDGLISRLGEALAVMMHTQRSTHNILQ